jgi:16S rRNA (guanine527-N7)-methyltransferase
MNDARIAELLEPFLSDGGDSRRLESQASSRSTTELSPTQVQLISMFIDILLRWNDRVNLTAIREPEEIVTRHFGESIFAAMQLFPRTEVGAGTTAHVIDVGSGAGFPGLPTKIWAPHIHLTLIESNQKKATFLREVVRHLRLPNVDVFPARAKTYLGNPGTAVMLRAVEQFESVLLDAAGMVGPNGDLAVMLGESQLDRAGKLLPCLQWKHPIGIPLSSNRFLIIGRKASG